jgi:hypothetical protein
LGLVSRLAEARRLHSASDDRMLSSCGCHGTTLGVWVQSILSIRGFYGCMIPAMASPRQEEKNFLRGYSPILRVIKCRSSLRASGQESSDPLRCTEMTSSRLGKNAAKRGESFLQGLKPVGSTQFTSALKHRPPEEKDFFRSVLDTKFLWYRL